MAKQKIGKETRFLHRLLRGDKISRKQAIVQSKLGNPSATIKRIEEAGYNINRHYEMVRSKRESGSFRVMVVKYSMD